MLDFLHNKWLYVASGMYILALAIAIYFEFYYIALLPFAFFILWATFFKLEYVFFFIVLSTPLSINLEDTQWGGVGMALPTEPLLFGILILFAFKWLSGKSIDPRIFRHPVSYVIYAYLIWMTFTCVTSELPIVSLKYLTTRLWFIVSFYFLATHIFRHLEKINTYFLLYIFPLTLVVIYTVIRHAQFGFEKDAAHWVMEPLFKDHTSYGAVLAMYFPVTLILLFRKKENLLIRAGLVVSFLIIGVGLVLSYTRAAWISVVGAAVICTAMVIGIRLRTLMLTCLIAGGFLYIGWDDIQVSLSKNKQESSDKLEEHIGSISNVSSDASNLERLNRWHCAIEMFKARPVFGWGPGTYQFEYAPFQRSKDRTIISTNRGDAGNAHSEYLGPLSEQGVLGMATVIALLLMVSQLTFRLYRRIEGRELKITVLAVYLGLLTYFIHGTLNNFLDTDKASIPFWGFIAVLVAIDLYHAPVAKKRIHDNAQDRDSDG